MYDDDDDASGMTAMTVPSGKRSSDSSAKPKTMMCPTPADKMCCALSGKAWQEWKKSVVPPRRLYVGFGRSAEGDASTRVSFACIVDSEKRESGGGGGKKKKGSNVPELKMAMRYHVGEHFTKIKLSGMGVLLLVEYLLRGRYKPEEDLAERFFELGWELQRRTEPNGDRVIEVVDTFNDKTVCALVVATSGEIFLENDKGWVGAQRVLLSDPDTVTAMVPQSRRQEFLRERYNEGRVEEGMGLGTPATATALLIFFFNVTERALRTGAARASLEVVGDDANFEWTKFEENHLLMPLRCGSGLRDLAIPNVVRALGYPDLAEDLMYARKGVWSGRSGATGSGSSKKRSSATTE